MGCTLGEDVAKERELAGSFLLFCSQTALLTRLNNLSSLL